MAVRFYKTSLSLLFGFDGMKLCPPQLLVWGCIALVPADKSQCGTLTGIQFEGSFNQP